MLGLGLSIVIVLVGWRLEPACPSESVSRYAWGNPVLRVTWSSAETLKPWVQEQYNVARLECCRQRADGELMGINWHLGLKAESTFIPGMIHHVLKKLVWVVGAGGRGGLQHGKVTVEHIWCQWLPRNCVSWLLAGRRRSHSRARLRHFQGRCIEIWEGNKRRR